MNKIFSICLFGMVCFWAGYLSEKYNLGRETEVCVEGDLSKIESADVCVLSSEGCEDNLWERKDNGIEEKTIRLTQIEKTR